MKMVVNVILRCGVIAVLCKTVEALSIKGVASDIPSELMGKGLPIDIPGTSREKKERLMDAINKFRAEICARMKDEHNEKFKTFDKCKKFMEKACRPGKDDKMDGDKQEVSSGEGYCKEYFPEAERRAREQLEKEDREREVLKKKPKAAPPAPPPPPKEEEKKKEAPKPVPKEKKDESKGAAAPGPAPASSPSGAPGTGGEDFIPGKSKGKPAKIADDEAYYFKKDGKHMDRLHMDEDLKLPTQGYWGKLIEHEDMQTMTGDWGAEFGPNSGLKSVREICAKYPDSRWCKQERGGHVYHGTGSHFATPYILPFVITFVMLFP